MARRLQTAVRFQLQQEKAFEIVGVNEKILLIFSQSVHRKS
jgi:hypothetical protein